MKKDKVILGIIIGILLLGIIILVIINKESSNHEISSISDMNIDTEVTLDIDEDIDWDNYKIEEIELNNNTITITNGGVYKIFGIGTGIIVDAKGENVKLILNGVTINSDTGPCIWIEKSLLTVISLEDGTVNILEDTDTYDVDDEQEPNGVIFSKDNLVIEGNGILRVTSHFEDAIVSKDHLKINSGTFYINSNDDGIRGTDSVTILGGTFDITAKNDGIKSTNTKDTNLGYIFIENGIFDIVSKCDGIQAEMNIIIKDGMFHITTGGGSDNASTNRDWGNWNTIQSDNSAKGLKAGNDLAILDGTFDIDSSDDAIHSNNYIAISDGVICISSGDDGIHADNTLVIENGNIDIKKSYEGMEASNITINGGTIAIVADDDGINVAGGNDASSMGNRPGKSNFSSTNSNQKLTISSGYVFVDATGDGLDANGSIYMNGGTVIVNGPTNSGNGALDYDYECIISGGLLIASSSGGMDQTPSSSDINIININLSAQSKDTIISIRDSNDNEILTYAPTKSFSSIMIASQAFISGSTYHIYTGGSYSNTSDRGMYQNGIYMDGELLTTVTLNNRITNVGSNNGSNGPSGYGRR